jgi:tRNA(Ile)-lysidine synthase
VHALAERVLATIRKRELIRAGDRVAVAVSGGADSVALLLLLLELREELGIVLSVAHVNHKLRGAESEEDERFVAELARQHDLELLVRNAPVERAQGIGIEAAARKLRYEFFCELTRSEPDPTHSHTPRMSGARIHKIATGHTLDDQAETVLLRMFRGTGIRGLAGILPRLTLEHEGRACGEVVRPLLEVRREEIRGFLRERGQAWREDLSNQDPAFLRNKVRLRVLPALRETFGEPALENLADLAEIARAEEEEASTQYAVASTRKAAALDWRQLLALPLAARRRMVRGWIEAKAPDVSISFRLIEDILDLAQGAAGRRLELPGRCAVRVARGELRWEGASDTEAYEYLLPVPGTVELRELGTAISAVLTTRDQVPEAERLGLLDPERLQGELRVRNWRTGDRFWPANRKGAKKVKELLTERHAIGAEKKLWPVVAAGGELVWMRAFAAPERVRAGEGVRKVLWIRVGGEQEGPWG